MLGNNVVRNDRLRHGEIDIHLNYSEHCCCLWKLTKANIINVNTHSERGSERKKAKSDKMKMRWEPPPFEIAIAMEIALIWLLDDKKWWFSYFILISCCWCDLMLYARAFFRHFSCSSSFAPVKEQQSKNFSDWIACTQKFITREISGCGRRKK